MSLEALIQAEKRAVGVKQTEKSVAKNNAAKVYLAKMLMNGLPTISWSCAVKKASR